MLRPLHRRVRLPDGPASAVVMLAFWFTPHTEVGAARPSRFQRLLRQRGTVVDVVCSSAMLRRESDLEALARTADDRVLRVPGQRPGNREALAARLLVTLQRQLLPNDDRLGWLPSATRAAARVMTSRAVLVSTHPPVVTHLTALLLKLRYGRPWIADFRDPLLGNPCRTSRRASCIDVALEGLVLGIADAVIANTDGAAAALRRRYPRHAAKVRVIWNGLDPDTPIAPVPPSARTRRRITHTGTLYADRTLLPVARSLARLIEAGALPAETVELRQIGRVAPGRFDMGDPGLAALARAGCLYRSPRQLPPMEARREMLEADVLLLLDLNHARPHLQVPFKTFEYVCTGKPILAVTAPGSATRDVLALAGVPHLCIDPSEDGPAVDAAILAFLTAAHAPAAPSPRFLAAFGAATQAAELAAVIEAVQDRALTTEPAGRAENQPAQALNARG